MALKDAGQANAEYEKWLGVELPGDIVEAEYDASCKG